MAAKGFDAISNLFSKGSYADVLESLKTYKPKKRSLRAEKEYFNRGVRKFAGQRALNNQSLFEKYSSNKGSLIDINLNNPLVLSLAMSLEPTQLSQLKVIFKMISRRINIIKSAMKENDISPISDSRNDIQMEDLIRNIKELKANGIDNATIISDIMPLLGYTMSNLPSQISELLNDG